jgi:hypothetical protein
LKYEPLAIDRLDHQRSSMRRFSISLATLVIVGSLTGACSPSDTPTEVAEAFYDQMAAGNIDAAKGLSTPDTAEMLSYIASMHDQQSFEVIAEGGASGVLVEGDNALVSFVEGGGYATVPLVKMGGEWKVDFATMIKAHSKPRPNPVQLTL